MTIVPSDLSNVACRHPSRFEDRSGGTTETYSGNLRNKAGVSTGAYLFYAKGKRLKSAERAPIKIFRGYESGTVRPEWGLGSVFSCRRPSLWDPAPSRSTAGLVISGKNSYPWSCTATAHWDPAPGGQTRTTLPRQRTRMFSANVISD